MIDYYKSGFVHGHIAPAGDFTTNSQAMADSFYLSNIVPQEATNNSGSWKNIEIRARGLAKKYKDVFVMTGAVYSNPSKTVGPNKVCVPTHLYKIVVVPSIQQAIAWMIPNRQLPSQEVIPYTTTISQIEQLAHVKLTPSLSLSETHMKFEVGENLRGGWKP